MANNDLYRQAALSMIRPAGGQPGSAPARPGGSPMQAGAPGGMEPAATVGTLLADAVRVTLAAGWTPDVNAAWTQAIETLKAQLPGTSPQGGMPAGAGAAPPMGMVAAQGAPMVGRPPR